MVLRGDMVYQRLDPRVHHFEDNHEEKHDDDHDQIADGQIRPDRHSDGQYPDHELYPDISVIPGETPDYPPERIDEAFQKRLHIAFPSVRYVLSFQFHHLSFSES